MEETKRHLRDLPRELLIDLLVKSQVAIKTGEGTIYEKDVVVILDDGATVTHKAKLCGICGLADVYPNCQEDCDVCGELGCRVNQMLESFHDGRNWDFYYIHTKCFNEADYKQCTGSHTCGTMTSRQCSHERPCCVVCIRHGCDH